MSSLRPLRDAERSLIVTIIRSKPELLRVLPSVDGMRVEELNDGGMGSLLLFPDGCDVRRRSMGRQCAAAEVDDADGVAVSVALNLDEEGRLFELDIWKVDFSPLLALPAATGIRIGQKDSGTAV